MADPVAEDTTYLGHRTWKNQAGTELEAYFLQACVHSVRGFLPQEQIHTWDYKPG